MRSVHLDLPKYNVSSSEVKEDDQEEEDEGEDARKRNADIATNQTKWN